MKKTALSVTLLLIASYLIFIPQTKKIRTHHFQNSVCYTITEPGTYVFDEDIEWCPSSKNAIALTIASDDVEIDGNNKFFTQTYTKFTHTIAVQIAEGRKNICIKNMNIQNFSGGAIWVHGSASHIVAQNLKFTHCGYGDATNLDKQSLPKDVPSYVTFAILLDGGYKKPIQHIQIIDCVFAESGVRRDPARFAQTHSAICAYQGSNIDITGCTIDGAVALKHSAAVTLASLSNVTIKDIFITDIFAKGTAKGIFTSDVDGEVKDVQQTSIVSNMPRSQFLYYLDNHASYKEDVEVDPEYRIAANHFKGIIPQHKENLDALLYEHKWREFRTLGRLVCHNSDKKSQTSAMYAKWVEVFCADVLDVKVKVISGFANFYPSGQTPLPAHRDQYKKWIIGLSFGDTRTLEFVPDDKNGSIVPFTMEAGDVFIFSPDVNNRYEHRMMPEQGGKRINLTYFLEILPGEDSAKLLKVPNNLQPSKIPTLSKAL